MHINIPNEKQKQKEKNGDNCLQQFFKLFKLLSF